jgi:hypothetical protein
MSVGINPEDWLALPVQMHWNGKYGLPHSIHFHLWDCVYFKLCPFKIDEFKRVLQRVMRFIRYEKQKETSKDEDLGQIRTHATGNRH